MPDPTAPDLTVQPPSPTGFTTGPYMGPPGQTSDLDVPSGAGELFDPGRLTEDLGSMLARHDYQVGGPTGFEELQRTQAGKGVAAQYAPVPGLTKEAANEQFGVPAALGQPALTFDNDVPQAVAQSLHDERIALLQRQEIAAREPGGLWNRASQLGVGLLSGALDPLNIAASVIPVVGEARYAEWLAASSGVIGRTITRAAVGAATGAVGQIPLVALRAGLASEDQESYTAANMLLDIVYGGALGGGLHASAGLLGDLAFGYHPAQVAPVATADLATREAAMRTSIAQVMEDRPVEVGPIFEAGEARQMTSMPNVTPETFRLMSQEATLREQDAALAERLNGLPAGDASAADRLNRLETVERQLADESLTAAERKPLMDRRDQLLVDTNPETLREAAAPIEQRRVMEAQREAIAGQLAEIEKQRGAGAAEAAFSPLLKPGSGPSMPTNLPEALNNAAGRPMADETARSASADAAMKDPLGKVAETPTTAPAPVKDEITELENFVKQAQANGLIEKDHPELAAANENLETAKRYSDVVRAAAACLGAAAE